MSGVMRDPTLPHQIVVGVRWKPGGTLLYVSCNCRCTGGETYAPLEMRELWEAGDALAVWRAHMAEVAA